ncbi:MAG: caspase family protein, partial [Rectinema sp.]
MRSEQKKEPRGENPGPGHRRMFLRAIALFVCAAIFALAFSGCEFFPTNASTLGGNKYAVVVGINDYINGSDLNYCVADAESMKKMLEDAGWTVNPITAESGEAIKKNATKSAIETALKSVPAETTTFLFYYSGHGSIDYSDDAYIVPSDYDGSVSSLISATEFSGWLDSVTATNKSVILDSCYSGGFVDAGDSVDAVPGDSAFMQTSTAADMFFRFGELLAQNAAASSTNPSTAPLVISAAGWA